MIKWIHYPRTPGNPHPTTEHHPPGEVKPYTTGRRNRSYWTGRFLKPSFKKRQRKQVKKPSEAMDVEEYRSAGCSDTHRTFHPTTEHPLLF